MGQRKGKLSVIIPAYNEEKMIHKTSVIIADILKQGKRKIASTCSKSSDVR